MHLILCPIGYFSYCTTELKVSSNLCPLFLEKCLVFGFVVVGSLSPIQNVRVTRPDNMTWTEPELTGFGQV